MIGILVDECIVTTRACCKTSSRLVGVDVGWNVEYSNALVIMPEQCSVWRLSYAAMFAEEEEEI